MRLCQIAPPRGGVLCDLFFEGYEGPKRGHNGSHQRGGIDAGMAETESPARRVAQAWGADFPLGEPPHLPRDVREAVAWQAKTPASDILEFWEKKLRWLREAGRREGGGAGAGVNVGLLRWWMREENMGGEDWAQNFVTGFTLAGDVDYSGIYPAQPLPSCQEGSFSTGELAASGAAHWGEVEGILRAGAPDEKEIWDLAMKEVAQGWLEPPAPAGEFDWADTVPVTRFLVRQGEKVRPVDNFRRSGVNRATRVHSPIVLPAVDHLVAVILGLQEGGVGGVGLFKGDHKDAYKQLPMRRDESRLGIVVARRPRDGAVCGFRPRALLFGAASAVLHYNSVSRVVATLLARAFRLPVLGYFDDFAGATRLGLEAAALEVFNAVNEELGFVVKKEKGESGRAICFLGVCVRPVSGGGAEVNISGERRSRLIAAINGALESGLLPPAEAPSLAGKLNFAQCAAFAKVGRSFFPSIYAHERRRGAAIGKRLRADLEWWVDFLGAAAPRMVRKLSKQVDALLYTDAAGDGGLGAVAFWGAGAGGLASQTWWGALRPGRVRELGEGTNEIYALEAYAALVSVREFCALRPSGGNLVVYVDNNAALAAITKGSAKIEAVNGVVRALWGGLALSGWYVWFARVPSKANPADVPSRARCAPAGEGWARFAGLGF